MATSPSSGADPRSLFAYLLLAFALLWGWQYSHEHAQIDFHAQISVASLADSPEVDDIYDPDNLPRLRALLLQRSHEQGADEVETSMVRHMPGVVASPFCFAVFRALYSPDYYAAWKRYRLLMLLGLAAGIFIPARQLGLERPEAALATALFCSPVFEPTRSLLRAGNVASLQLGAAALLLWIAARPQSKLRDLSFGGLLALLILFKPTLLPLLPLLALLRYASGELPRLGDEGLGFVLGTVVGFFAPNLFLGGAHHWTDWAEFLPTFLAGPPSLERGNFALSQLLPGRLSPLLAWAGLCLAAWSIWVTRREHEGLPPERLTALTFALALALSVLAGQLVWLHYQLLVAPLIVVALAPGQPELARWAPHRRVFAITGCACIALHPLRELLGMEGFVEQAWVVNLGLLMLLAVAILDPFIARRTLR